MDLSHENREKISKVGSYLGSGVTFLHHGTEYPLDGVFSNGDIHSEYLGEVSIEDVELVLKPLSSLETEDIPYITRFETSSGRALKKEEVVNRVVTNNALPGLLDWLVENHYDAYGLNK